MLYQTHVQINTQNFLYNINQIKKKIGNKDLLLAVKANAYGHGSIELSKLAEQHNINWLGIATIPEALILRQAGINASILKFSPAFPEEMEEAINNNITLPIADINNAKQLNEIAKKNNRIINIHIKIDTGMGRIGVLTNEVEYLANYIVNECHNLIIDGVFSHLPRSDDPNEVNYTNTQIEHFIKLSHNLQKIKQNDIKHIHLANSGGILAYPQSYLSMVRPGIMLYGYYPSNSINKSVDLKPVLSFHTKISFIKKIPKGFPVGYNATWIAHEDGYLATIPVGYADGFNRLFSNKAKVIINGEFFPIVGRICMDQSMIFLGNNNKIKVADTVILIGEQNKLKITAQNWADELKTISYEVTCQINSRVSRIYL